MKIDPNLIGKMVNAVPQLRELGIKLVEVDMGGRTYAATLALPYAPHLVGYTDTGVIAGGAIYSLMDSVCGMAVYARLASYAAIATLDLRIDYLKPATPEKTVYGWAQCYKLTRHIAFVRGVAYHDDRDDPIAQAAGTFMIPNKEKREKLAEEGEAK